MLGVGLSLRQSNSQSVRAMIARVTLALLCCMFAANARTLRVPEQFTFIQTAIDSSQSGDTILIEPAIYPEALVIVDRSLTLAGTAPPDSANGIGVVINPTSLPLANELACLEIHGGDSVKLRNLWFRNGEAMHEDRQTDDPGGIDNSHGLLRLALSNCRFDSVYACIRRGVVVELDSVVMFNSQRRCISRGDSGRVLASNCRFHGAVTNIMVSAWSGSTFASCSFTNLLNGWLLSAGQDSITVLDCDFGPFYGACDPAILIRAGSGSVIAGNVFHDFEIGDAVLEINQADCETVTDPSFRHPLVIGNRFERIGPGDCQEGVALRIKCDGDVPAFLGSYEDNVFTHVTSLGYFGNAMSVHRGAAMIEHNVFANAGPDSCGAVYVLGVEPPEILLLRRNAFDSLAFGVQHASDDEFTDARLNWWGDATGPFNLTSNPNGLGAAVDDDVLFSPWLLVPPDSSDTNEVAVELPPLGPDEYLVSAFPNPFNGTTTLKLAVAVHGSYMIMLYDITGRLVQTAFEGVVAHSQDVTLDLRNLPSGLYFAQLRSASRPLSTAKLLLLK